MKGAKRQNPSPSGPGLFASPTIDRAIRGALEQVAVARYIADMTAQLQSMAIAARLDLLAYFLDMARAEGETSARVVVGEPDRADSESAPAKPFAF